MRALLVLLAVVGCGADHHVHIPALPPDLTPDQRVEAYQHYRQGGSGVEYTTTCGQRTGCSTTTADILVLRDGSEIHDADDLLPLLPSNSVAARAAREVEDAHRGERRWKWIGWSMFLGGIAAIVVGVKADVPPATAVGLVSVIGSPFVAIGGMLVAGWGVKGDTKTAFTNYDQALAERLNVCVNGLAVVACENSTPGMPPPVAEPDPALKSLRQK